MRIGAENAVPRSMATCPRTRQPALSQHCGVTEDLSGRRYVLPALIRQEVVATTARRVSIHGHERAPLIATVRPRLMLRAIHFAHATAANQHDGVLATKPRAGRQHHFLSADVQLRTTVRGSEAVVAVLMRNRSPCAVTSHLKESIVSSVI